jgi:hypothetical protein
MLAPGADGFIEGTIRFLRACFATQPKPADFQTMLTFNMLAPHTCTRVSRAALPITRRRRAYRCWSPMVRRTASSPRRSLASGLSQPRTSASHSQRAKPAAPPRCAAAAGAEAQVVRRPGAESGVAAFDG